MSNRMIGPFELGDKLGAGGMGIVYRAIYTKTGVPCAIKVLAPDVNDSPGVQQRFEREIAILKKLQHPHIVRYFGGGKVGSQRFYAMELVAGGSLENYLEQKKRLPWEEALDYARQIAEALEHAHAAGVIHRDLKPANLLMGPNHKLKLTDFGIARDTTKTALTAAGKTVGTYAYMAPEQIRGKPPVDRRTDLYSLGCVLFEMIAGETPFDGDNPGEVLVHHLQEEPTRVTSYAPDCPIWLEDLIFRLLEKEPDERPYDALAVQVAIDEVRDKVAAQASMVGNTLAGNATKTQGATAAAELRAALGQKKKKKKREKSPIYERLWFLMLCLVLLGGGVTWVLWPPGEDALMAKAEPLMKSEDPSQWLTARDNYLKPLLERFPEGKHVDQAQDYIDEVDMYYLERQAKLRAVGRKPAKSEGEKLFLQANDYENSAVQDRVTALEKYESMIELLKGRDGDDRLFVVMAGRRAAKIRAEGGNKLTRVEIVEDALQRADKLAQAGQLIEARNIWDSIVELYRDNQELAAHVEHAQERLKKKPSEK